MNQIQVLGIIRKHKVTTIACDTIRVPILEIEYLMDYGNNNYNLENIKVVLDDPALKPWVYVNKGALVYIIGKGVWIDEELVISATNLLLIRDRTGKSGTTLLFSYGTHINQFLISGDITDPAMLTSDAIMIRGSIKSYNDIPVIPSRQKNTCVTQEVPYLIRGKPSKSGIVLA